MATKKGRSHHGYLGTLQQSLFGGPEQKHCAQDVTISLVLWMISDQTLRGGGNMEKQSTPPSSSRK